ncbi:hypothetical protein [Bradyrhizobium japonicum]|uniref:hypothetical protein n=1 Tax=Bradyrhizobium japonicum TaxID=375 RepID=UPI001E3108A5|nr:hypothetical protein [Bradyrhizobium japonicum]MCD9817619.1 hypothetical protein [Bradyrhizobium japonicum]MEB2672538.1 hypothetical protein [Bradyrhizobium japonicum]WRI91799.1 hypothetical protein R3F75_13065 [Bradyrhizobium japonicum]
MSAQKAFVHTTVPYGDDGKLVRGVIARCGAPGCEAAIPLAVNTLQNSRGDDSEIEWRFIARKLEAKGWHVGRSRTAHRCPRCHNAAKFSTIKKSRDAGEDVLSPSPMVKKGNAMPNGNAMTEKLTVVKDNMRVMTREDRRIVFEKLNEVYVNDKIGYGNGWTDEKVATDLGVPRAWIKLIRDENFGDEVGNENIREQVKEARDVLMQIKAIEPRISEAQRLIAVADKIEKSLAEIAKVLK